ncbi:MAG TPA: two-component regulator propeller domain-containing protein [Cyclobacteriaceae bacterium]|nr:two-component regulator propeller domain-containing protein [Cyclobacteriaceae bacterium]
MKRELFFYFSLTVLTLSSCENISEQTAIGSPLTFIKSEFLFNESEVNVEILSSDSLILPDFAVYTIDILKDGSAWFYGHRQSQSDSLAYIIHFINNAAYLYTFADYPEVPFIKHISHDGNNHVFFSGFTGLLEYNGMGFYIYQPQDIELRNLKVICVGADHEENVWFSLNDVEKGGIIKTDFETWSYFTPENSPIPNRLIKNIEVDSDNRAWLSANDYVGDGGIIRVSEGSWKVFDLGLYWIRDLVVNTSGNVYTFIDYSLSSSLYHDGTYVMEYDGNGWKSVGSCEDPLNCPFGIITSNLSDNEGNIWISAFEPNSGPEMFLYCYNGYEWSKYETPGETIFDMAVDPDGIFWLGTSGGIYKMSPVQNKL